MVNMGIWAKLGAALGLSATPRAHYGVKVRTTYHVECYGADGRLRWVDEADNIVVTSGLNKLLDATLKTGLASPTWYLGLKNSAAGIVLADTLASHAGWTETTSTYSGNRKTWTPGTIAAGSVDNSGSVAVFSMTGTVTIYGCLMCDQATGTSGILYGAVDFSTSRSVASGDTLNVTVTCSVS